MRALAALAKLATRRPLAVVLAAVLLGAGGAALAARLSPTAASSTFVESSSSTYRATQRFYSQFGEEPVEVLVKGNLQEMLLSSDVVRLAGLEGCLSGRTPRKALAAEGGVGGPCGQVARLNAVKSVLGPGTFLNEAALEIDSLLQRHRADAERLASKAGAEVHSRALKAGRSEAEAQALGKEAQKAIMTGYAAEVASMGVRYGIDSIPSLTDANFVSTVVFSSSAKIPGTPKQRFAYLFPSRDAALISVRLRPGLSEARRNSAIDAIRKAIAMPQWQLTHGERYLLTGEPVIVSELTGSISSSMLMLLIAVVALMALTLSLVFTGRPRLLPLAIALLAVSLTFGALALLGLSLSVAEVAVLPALTGLAVDYAIQLHSRASEVLETGDGDVGDAVLAAVRAGGPSIVAAAAASAAAVLVLEISPVPTVRAFALLLAIGLALALLCALLVGSSAIMLSAEAKRRRARTAHGAGDRRWAEGRNATGAGERRFASGAGGSRRAGMPFAVQAGALAASWRGAQDLLLDNRLTRLASSLALERVVRRPWAALGVGVLLAAVGWGLAGITPVQTDIAKLVPQEMPSLRNLTTLERVSGVGGQIDLMVSGRNVAKPASIEWMTSYEREMLTRFGRGPSGGGCGSARLCAAFSLPSIFDSGSGRPTSRLTSAEVNELLSQIPPYFSENVISSNRRVASLAFGVRLMPLSAEQRMIEVMQASLTPPAGLHAQLVGLPVMAAQADSAVASPSRRLIELLLGLAAVAAVLLIAFRGDVRRALLPLVPVALATGWSALVLFLVQVPLNPMSVTLSALVIAVATEFSVLLCERHRFEMQSGHSPAEALRRAYRRTGAAVAASGVTAIVGFGAIALSEIAMLRDFGIVTVIDLSISLLGVMLMLPVTMTLAEEWRERGLSWRRTARLSTLSTESEAP